MDVVSVVISVCVAFWWKLFGVVEKNFTIGVLLIWKWSLKLIIFNHNMEKLPHAQQSVERNYLSIPKLQRLEMDEWFYLTLFSVRNY